jgi:transposase
MARGRPKAELRLSAEARGQLQGVASSRALPHGLVRRVQIVLAGTDGESNSAIAKRMGLTKATVGKWRQRYLENGIEGLHHELRAGRPRSFEDDRVAEVINRALQTRPPSGSHWSVRGRAAHTGVSKSTVQRWFQLFGVQPHRQKQFKLSNDPFFVEKVRDIVGLYLNPPDHAVALCVDEKSRIQAQLRHPQARQGQGVAGPAPALPRPLHPDLCLVAEPGRAVVRPHHPTGHPARLVLECQGTGDQDRPLRRTLQRSQPPLRLDRNRRINPGQTSETLRIYLWDRTLGDDMNAARLTRRWQEAAGDPGRMVEALVDEIDDPATGLVTRDFLRAELSELESRLTWRFVTLLGVQIALVGILATILFQVLR